MRRRRNPKVILDRADGYLFHGTIEDFDPEDIRGGGYDGVLWTAEDSTVAQSYIPSSGAEVSWVVGNFPNEEARPAPQGEEELDYLTKLAGKTFEDVKYDSAGVPRRWVSKGSATQRDITNVVRDLGYDTSRPTIWLKVGRDQEKGPFILPADHREEEGLAREHADQDEERDEEQERAQYPALTVPPLP